MRKYSLLVLLLLFMNIVFAQNDSIKTPPKNWFNLDPVENQVNGVSSDKAYKELLIGKTGKKVIVAVIDSGIDIEHEDLKGVIWANPNEIPNNGIDDDNNGYIDDVHGWNFLGGKEGKNVNKDSYEVTRMYKMLRPKYEGKSVKDIDKKDRVEFATWEKVKGEFEEKYTTVQGEYSQYSTIAKQIERFNKLFEGYLDVDGLTAEKLKGLESNDAIIDMGKGFVLQIFDAVADDITLDSISNLINLDLEQMAGEALYSYSLEFDASDIVGDNPAILDEKGYGNNDVIGKNTDNFHGTHVAGIIAAQRGNGIGTDGVANNVSIMALRAVPDGDEHDKDVANAIRYAVDNGALVINMSFGKAYSPNIEYVRSAIEYAASNGVLLVHAAGNGSSDNDEVLNFPNDNFGKEDDWAHWIEVGASSWGKEGDYIGNFTNYGDKTVDLFAPGVAIYSTAPSNQYQDAQGTSMASPVTAGVAAMLFSYFPDLNAEQVKDILMRSVRKLDGLRVLLPGSIDQDINFSKLSKSGGIINAYEAVKLAQSMNIKGKR
ncbi:MAG: subtilisin family serine protease [Candidatus Endobugula sp.]|jgi:subtilisin family serine protease